MLSNSNTPECSISVNSNVILPDLSVVFEKNTDFLENEKFSQSTHEIEENSTRYLKSRRIVDAMYIFDQIRNANYGIGLSCTVIDCVFFKEIRLGYFSSWIFKYKMCNILTKIESEKVDSNLR
ncbi:Uncharacterized protein FWK35_00012607 [Aphis craccivora]|uniref:Uncharacterized protein n=1 Tax=Aphis craccivora TaxID=307492 RepID=A0A6G0YCN6_APHCR|nr:Uncharacterized protein FWK35_00012607 [Aphis craccivora]